MEELPAPLRAAAEALPAPLAEELARHWQDYREAATAAAVAVPEEEALLRVVGRVWPASPFVAQACRRHPALFHDLVASGDLARPYEQGEYRARVAAALADCDDDEALATALRRLRRREMVRIAWRDIAEWADLDETLAELSALARACIDGALGHLYPRLCRELGTPHGRDSGQPQQLVVLGMGKLGADELNFSSDIDLIFAYPEEGETVGGSGRSRANQEFFLRLGQRLIDALGRHSAEGFVFRVDMRLRPFGDSGPLASSFAALESYYQTHGREWERYALVKADVVAGDRRAGAELLERLRPFVYRRYVDFGAFEALREMKAMIARQVAARGMENNVKLGPGGIREVEFIGQAFQLIRGGREPELRQRSIRKVLALLGARGHLPPYAAEALDQAYVFLRRVENRIQEMEDQQRHELPTDEIGRARLTAAMGFDRWERFEAELAHHRHTVHAHFEQVFNAPQREEEGRQPSSADSAWRGGVDVAHALRQLGYDDPQRAAAVVERLRNSRRYQGLTAQGKARLDHLMPLLLGAAAGVENGAETLERVVALVEAIARRSAYLALLVENPLALSQLVRLCSASPWVAAHLARYPLLLDELLDPRALYAPLDREALKRELDRALARAGDDEEQQLEALRHFKHANVLKVAAADIAGVYPLMEVSDHLTEIAEVVVERALELARDHLVARHGRPRCRLDGEVVEPGFAVIAYGKMGGIELGYGSDLDLVFLHGAGGETLPTDGERPIDTPLFFARLGQRLIHILTAHTPAGVLYEVDPRLRPSGSSGLLVSSIEAFERYQMEEAWTWEHQALVRARAVAGDAALAERFEAIRRRVLGRERDPEALRREVVEMREKMRAQLDRSNADQFDLKQGRGGIADIEFMVQYAILRWAASRPALLRWSDNVRQLETLAAEGLFEREEAETLADAYRTYRAASHRLALQQAPARVEADRFTAEREAVRRIWRRRMETVQ